MGSPPEDSEDQRSLAPKELNSLFADEVRRLKRELTAQLFIQHGWFWDAVSDVRQRWSVRAKRALPGTSITAYPEGVDESMKQWDMEFKELVPEWSPFDHYSEYPESVDDESRDQWSSDIRALQQKTIPEAMERKGYWWSTFLTACVLYDPPDLQLLEFAAYDDPKPEPLFPLRTSPDILPYSPKKRAELSKRREEESRRFIELDPMSRAFKEHWSRIAISLPPVVHLADPKEVEQVERWFYEKVLHEILERYVKPQGLDAEGVLDDAMFASGLMEEYLDRRSQISQSYYIVVDEYTSEKDVGNARRAIRATQGHGNGGRPRRDPLVALTCALLHDRYNEADPTDKRVKRWSYRRLFEKFQEFGVRSERSAEEYTNLGRRLLENRFP